MNFVDSKEFILAKLSAELSPTLYYHSLNHVLDVVEASERIARAEGITDKEPLMLLQTAALFHDVGFLTTYKGHEEVGCQYVKQVLPDFDYNPSQIDIICGMILATRIPQKPQNKLEEIICDADLDYLGRSDFEPIAYSLFEELKAREMVTDEATWNRIQVGFLESHHYWTQTAISTRQASKAQRLQTLRALIQ